MNRHGQRFILVQDFISYCRDINVETDKRELEYYEKIGAMLPFARIVYPEKYVVQRTQIMFEGVRGCNELSEWPELERLIEPNWFFPESFRDLPNEELVHCFDREVGCNSFLSRPDAASFKPWDKYRVLVPNNKGQDFDQSTVEHYYSYWQVHQLYFIQQYPDLYKNKSLIDQLPPDDPHRKFRPFSPNMEYLVEFKDTQQYFNALSFWTTIYERECKRTFANVDATNGVRRLNEVQLDNYRRTLRELANTVIDRFKLTHQNLYEFLSQLIELHENYRRDERYKLSDELKKDVFCWGDIIQLYTGDNREKMSEELSKRCAHWSVRTFRHLDIVTKERDYALDMTNRVSTGCISKLHKRYGTKWTFTEEDGNGLMDYCEQKGLGLVPTALSGMVSIGNEEYRDKFRRVQMYTNLKNFLTSYEYLLKSLGVRVHPNIEGKTLAPVIKDIMCRENWFGLYDAKRGLSHADNVEKFLNNLDTLLNDSQLKASVDGYWAQVFLIACLARNCTVHFYPSEDRYYGDLFGTMLDSAIAAMLYTWKLAKRENWV